jgi:glyoxylase-like metal-dependent hydrolase (beta-lactamase superfamily II)
VDTGYGVGNLASEVRDFLGYARKGIELTVINTHGHFDHAAGNYQFPEILIHPEDFPVLEKYTSPFWLERNVNRARERNLLPADYDSYHVITQGWGKAVPLTQDAFDLGGVTARVIHMPGHTPGSVGILIEEDGVLLIGDNWNPTTWVFFDECVPMRAYRDGLRKTLALPFDTVISPHSPTPRPRGELETFVRGLDAISLATSKKVVISPYEAIDTRSYTAEGSGELVFDANKLDI